MLLTIYAVFLAISSIISLIFFIYFIKDKNRLSMSIGQFSLLNFLYTFGMFAQLIARSETQALLFFRLSSLGAVFILPLFIYTINLFSDSLHSKRNLLLFMFIISFVFLLMVYTNEYHLLYYKSLNAQKVGNFFIVKKEFGVLYYIEFAYQLLLVVLSGFFIRNIYLRNTRFIKKVAFFSAITLFVFVSLKTLNSFAFFQLNTDLVPLANALGLALYMFTIYNASIFRYIKTNQLITPELTTGFIVVNDNNDILYFNPEALRLLPELKSSGVGNNFSDLPLTKLYLQDDIEDGFVCESNYGDKEKFFLFKHKHLPKTTYFSTSYYVFVDFTEQIYFRKKIERLATRDGLTQIYNQMSILNLAENSFNKAKKTKSLFSITILDIDNFKVVNDKFGHVFGNNVLVDVANKIASFFKETCCNYGRFGGDEFLIVCDDCVKDKHQQTLKSLINELSNLQIFESNGLKLSISIGTHYVDFTDDTTTETYLEALDVADKNMYKDKAKNKAKF